MNLVGETVELNKNAKMPERRFCTRCGFVASQEICKACVLLEGLNRGMPKLGVTKSNKAKKIMGLEVKDGSENISKKKLNRDNSTVSKRKLKREQKKEAMTKPGYVSRLFRPPKATKDVDACSTTTFSVLSDCSRPSTSRINSDDEELPESKEDTENKKQSSCGEGCTSECGSEPPESSKRKKNVENKKQSSCGQGCMSECGSKTLKSSKLNDEIINAYLLTSEMNPNDYSTSSTFHSSVPSESIIDSGKEEEPIVEIKEKKEKVVCQCPPGLRADADASASCTDDTDDSDNEVFDLHMFMKMINTRISQPWNPRIVTEAESESDDLIDVDGLIQPLTEFMKTSDLKVAEQESKPSSNTNLDSKIETQPLSIQKESIQPNVLTVNNLKNSESQSTACLETTERSADEQPAVVKANAKRIKPSLMLPEMMYKAPNNLDF